MEYFALLIPILLGIILYVWFDRQMLWWEFLIPFCSSIIIIFIFKYSAETYNVTDKEFMNSPVDYVYHDDEWDEWITQTCSRSCCCDSKGQNCGTETYDCSYRSYHPECWGTIDIYGGEHSMTEFEYKKLTKQFGNESFVEMNRDYYTIDGDRHISKWNRNDINSVELNVSSHNYTNRVQASNSILNYSDMTEDVAKIYSLYDYPEIVYNRQKHILGFNDALGERKMEILSSILGPKKQLASFILVFKNKSLDFGFKQQQYWKNGNKNEFIVCIGIDDKNNVKWCHPFGWTDQKICEVEVRNFVMTQKTLNLPKVVDFMYSDLDKKFVRKQFAEFNYIQVDLTTTQTIWLFVLVTIISVGTSIWVVKNEFDEDYKPGNKKFRY